MGRTVLIVSVSVLVGAGSAYLLLPAPQTRYVVPSLQTADGGRAASDEPPAKRGTVPTLSSLLDGPFTVRERAVVYGIVAEAGLDTLSAMARDLWAEDQSMSRRFALDVVFSRMTEIDRNAGINLIRDASPDGEQTLAAALAVIASRGVTEAEIDSIVAALPRLDERRFRSETLKRLAVTDPDQATALAMLDAGRNSKVPERQLEILSAVRGVAETDPRRALELADGLEGQQREIALRAAIQAWSSEDPYGALGLVQRLGPGRDRDTLTLAIGEELGRQDPDGALAWFDSLDSSPPGLYGSVLRGIAQTKPQRAMELALDSGDPSAVFLTSKALRSGDVSFAGLAEHVLATDNRARRDGSVQMLINAWVDNDPEEALSWLVSHSENVGSSTLRQTAETVARQNPDAAIRATQLLPVEARGEWVRGVASGYAESDPAAARTWIERFRGEAGYDAGMTAIVQASAMRDPASAAAMLPGLAAAPARDRAATTVAQQWAEREPQAARNWATTLPVGPLRDAALTGVMMISDELPNPATLAQFQSDQARQQAILHVASRRAQENLDDARAMVERHIDDPALRGQAEQMLESARSVLP